MTTAVGKILERAEQLSAAEQWELAVKLNERLEYQAESTTAQADLFREADVALPSQTGAEPSLLEATEDDELTDVFSLNRVPPTKTYLKRVRYKYIGRLQPLPYPLEPEAETEEQTA